MDFSPCVGVVFSKKYYKIHCYVEWPLNFGKGEGGS